MKISNQEYDMLVKKASPPSKSYITLPSAFCIGGGICKEGETLLAPLRSYIERQRYSKHSARQTVLTTALLGNDAGIIGAAALCD